MANITLTAPSGVASVIGSDGITDGGFRYGMESVERIAQLENHCAELRIAFTRLSEQIISLTEIMAKLSDSQRMLALMYAMQSDALPGEYVPPRQTHKAN